MSTKKEDKNIIVDRERFEMLSSLFFELNGEIVIFLRKKSDKEKIKDLMVRRFIG